MAVRETRGLVPVLAALGGNIGVLIIKALVASASGSSAMFAEAIHSAADTLNQALLLIGIRRSRRKADEEFHYGYGPERFFWALISACGIFFIGACVSVYRGVMALLYPQYIELTAYAFLVLAVSFVIEFWTFRIATRALVRAHPTLSWWERLDYADPTTLAVCLEDGIAVIGVVVAAIAIFASYITSNPTWDAGGSIAVGLLLAGAAVILIMKNRMYLIGRSIPEDVREGIIEFLNKEPVIERVLDFKSSVIDVDVWRIKCEVEFNGSALLYEARQQKNIEAEWEDVQGDHEAFKRFVVSFAGRIPRLIGKKIDQIEGKLKKRYPQIQHIDIEIN